MMITENNLGISKIYCLILYYHNLIFKRITLIKNVPHKLICLYVNKLNK